MLGVVREAKKGSEVTEVPKEGGRGDENPGGHVVRRGDENPGRHVVRRSCGSLGFSDLRLLRSVASQISGGVDEGGRRFVEKEGADGKEGEDETEEVEDGVAKEETTEDVKEGVEKDEEEGVDVEEKEVEEGEAEEETVEDEEDEEDEGEEEEGRKISF